MIQTNNSKFATGKDAIREVNVVVKKLKNLDKFYIAKIGKKKKREEWVTADISRF